jgi:hypothetical protein
MFSIFTGSHSLQNPKAIANLSAVCPFIPLTGSYDPSVTVNSNSKNSSIDSSALSQILHEIGHAIDVFVDQDDWADCLMSDHYQIGYVVNSMHSNYTDTEVEREVNAHIISHLFAAENDILDQCDARVMKSKQELQAVLVPLCCKMQGTNDASRWTDYISETYDILAEYSMNIIWADVCQAAQRLREISADLSDKKVAEAC